MRIMMRSAAADRADRAARRDAVPKWARERQLFIYFSGLKQHYNLRQRRAKSIAITKKNGYNTDSTKRIPDLPGVPTKSASPGSTTGHHGDESRSVLPQVPEKDSSQHIARPVLSKPEPLTDANASQLSMARAFLFCPRMEVIAHGEQTKPAHGQRKSAPETP